MLEQRICPPIGTQGCRLNECYWKWPVRFAFFGLLGWEVWRLGNLFTHYAVQVLAKLCGVLP